MTEIWEYKTMNVLAIAHSTAALNNHMNDVAKDGWENHTIVFNSDGMITRTVWKRPIN